MLGFFLNRRLELIISAINLFFEEREEDKVEGEDYQGIIYSTGDEQCIGSFTGRPYEAKIDTEHGIYLVKFLVNKHVDK